MAKLMEFKEKLEPFGKIEQELVFEGDKFQVYYELKEGTPKSLISFLDETNKEVLSKELPPSAFIKPYTNKAKIVLVNTGERDMEIEFKIVAGVRVI